MKVPVAPFGRTGHLSSRVIFGAAALGSMSQERTDRVLELMVEHGVNHVDTAASYGAAEDRLAPFLARHRSSVFLATKTGERTGAAARRELEHSLDRMGVDRVELIQMHNLVEEDEWEIAFGPGGAYEALEVARAEGLVDFIGVTGHGLRIARMHQRSLERADLDSVLLPYNHSLMAIESYRREVDEVMAICVERQVAIQTIKSIARRRWPSDGQGPQYSWYEPLTDDAAISRAVRWVLADDRVFLNSTSDARLLPLVLAAAGGDVSRPSDDEMRADESAFGITALFDGADLELI